MLPTPSLAPGSGVTRHQTLTRKAKAAIVVQFLLKEGADVPLSELPEHLQVELTQQLGAMRYVDRDTLKTVMTEFADELDAIGMRFPGGLARALNALDGKVSPTLSRRLRKETGALRGGDPWDEIRALEVDRLVDFCQAESVEVAAVLISKLDVTKAAALLSKLPGDRARRITYAVSMTAQVTPEAVDRIGRSLVSQLEDEPPRAFPTPPVDRVGEILNYSPTLTRDEVLQGLEETDSAFAAAVRKAIFTFANIPERVNKLDIPKIPRDVDQAMLITALAGASSDVDRQAAAFILSNISRRMAEALRTEIEDRGTPTAAEAEEAMGVVVAAIRDMSATGEIKLRKPDENAA